MLPLHKVQLCCRYIKYIYVAVTYHERRKYYSFYIPPCLKTTSLGVSAKSQKYACDMIYDVMWYMTWYDMIYDAMWCDMVWYDIWWYMIRYMIYDMIWYDTIRYDIWYVWYMIWYDIWYVWYDIYDMICMIYLLTAIG